MEERKSKVDIIVDILGERNPEIQRLVALDDKVRTFVLKAEEGDTDSLMNIEIVVEWAMLQNKYYTIALEKKQTMN